MGQFFKLFGCDETSIGRHPYIEKYNQSEMFLRFKNKSEIRFQHMGNEKAIQAILSYDGCWFGIDQAEECPEDAYLKLHSRIGRVPYYVRDSKGKILREIPVWSALVGNPLGHDYVWKIFKKDQKRSEAKGFKLFEATTEDNVFRKAGYIETMKELYPPMMLKRYVYGSWDAFSGQVYDELEDNVHHIDPIEIPMAWRQGVGVDYGYNHPTAFIFVGVDYDGNHHAYQELVAREKTPDWYAERLKTMGIYNEGGYHIPFYGPHDGANTSGVSGQNYQQAYRDQGIEIDVGTRMSPVVRITKIKQLLKVREDENDPHPNNGGVRASRLYIHKNCEKLWECMLNYKWKDLKPGEDKVKEQPDEVVKVDDDEADALGQFEMSWSSRNVPVRPVIKDDRNIEEELFGDKQKVTDWRYN
jgi:hypothetical protein